MDWQSVVTSIGGSAAFFSAAAWFAKKVVTEQLARSTEAFKAEVKAQAEMEVEKLKNSLQMAATEHRVMFSRLHERRAEVIEETYKRLSKLFSSAQQFVLTSENNPANTGHKMESARLRHELIEYSSFIQQNRIYLPTAVCELLFDHLHKVSQAVHIAGAYGGRVHSNPFLHERSMEAFTKAYEAFNSDIPKAQELLEAEFRKMLGVH